MLLLVIASLLEVSVRVSRIYNIYIYLIYIQPLFKRDSHLFKEKKTSVSSDKGDDFFIFLKKRNDVDDLFDEDHIFS